MTRKPRGPVRIVPANTEHKLPPPFVSAAPGTTKQRHRFIGFLDLLPAIGLAVLLLYVFGAFR